jgi:hypothetical protein
VRDPFGVEAQPPNLADGLGVVVGVHGVGEQELRAPLRTVGLDWERYGRADEHAALANHSRLERRRDVLVSTLREVVAALGGELHLVAVFPDEGAVRIRYFDKAGAAR